MKALVRPHPCYIRQKLITLVSLHNCAACSNCDPNIRVDNLLLVSQSFSSTDHLFIARKAKSRQAHTLCLGHAWLKVSDPSYALEYVRPSLKL